MCRHLKAEELSRLKELFERRHERLTVLPIQASELHEMLDVNHLRPIIDGNWKQVFEQHLKSRRIVDWIQEVTDARNQWAHPGPGDVKTADANRVLDTCARITVLFDPEGSSRLEDLRDGTTTSPPSHLGSGQQSQAPTKLSDHRSTIREIVERLVRECREPEYELEDRNLTYTHFAPLKWDLFIPRVGTRESRRVLSFLIENRPTYLRLFLEICPGDQAIRARVFHTVGQSHIFRPPNQLAPQWCRVFRRDILSASDYEQLSIGQIEQRIRGVFRDFNDVTFEQIDSVVSGINFES